MQQRIGRRPTFSPAVGFLPLLDGDIQIGEGAVAFAFVGQSVAAAVVIGAAPNRIGVGFDQLGTGRNLLVGRPIEAFVLQG
jgi:hypothetical protein